MTTTTATQDEIDAAILAALRDETRVERILREVDGSNAERIALAAKDHGIKVSYEADDHEADRIRTARERIASQVKSPADFCLYNDLDSSSFTAAEIIAKEWGSADPETGKWSGVFMYSGTENPDRELIQKEVTDPGSVLTDGFATPWQQKQIDQLADDKASEVEAVKASQKAEVEAAAAQKKADNRRPVDVANAVRKELQAGQTIVEAVVATTPGATAEMVRAQAGKLGIRIFENAAEYTTVDADEIQAEWLRKASR